MIPLKSIYKKQKAFVLINYKCICNVFGFVYLFRAALQMCVYVLHKYSLFHGQLPQQPRQALAFEGFYTFSGIFTYTNVKQAWPVVEHLPHHPKVGGLSPATIERENGKKQKKCGEHQGRIHNTPFSLLLTNRPNKTRPFHNTKLERFISAKHSNSLGRFISQEEK